MRLLDFVRSLPDVGRLSRLRIEPGPGTCEVTASIASFGQRKLGAYEQTDGKVTLEPLRGPQRPKEYTPAVASISIFERVPDVVGRIESADLPGQIAELEASKLVGGLNVERLGERKTIISTHAATQEERNAWLLSK